jgi:hypothetical protein
MARVPARSAVVLVFTLAFGSACGARVKKVTPWLEYERNGPLIDIPHVITTRPYTEIVRVRLGDQWRELLRGESPTGFQFQPTVFDDGHAVLVRRMLTISMFREGSESLTTIEWSRCPWPELTEDRRLLSCFLFEHASGGREGPLVRARTQLRDSRGEILDTNSASLPEALLSRFGHPGGLVGWTAQGTPVFEWDLFDGAGKSTYVALALEPPVARELARVESQGRPPAYSEWARRIPGFVERADRSLDD